MEEKEPDHGHLFRFGELADRIMQRAWVELPNPGVAPTFARAALARLKRHEEVAKERKEIFEAPSHSPERRSDEDHLLEIPSRRLGRSRPE
jgi:hypothetical protein